MPQKKQQEKEKAAQKPKEVKSASQKASYKQKQEFKKVQEQISNLEDQKSSLVKKINQGTEDHEELLEWSNSIQAITEELEELEFRWLELSELDDIMD